MSLPSLMLHLCWARDVAVTTSVCMCGLHRAALLREQQVELEKRQQEMVRWSGP